MCCTNINQEAYNVFLFCCAIYKFKANFALKAIMLFHLCMYILMRVHGTNAC